MKRLLIGLLAVGLIAAFSMPALALDVKVTGSFFAAGYWESNRALAKDNEAAQRYYAQRLQVNPVFQVADGLRLVTRFEALERVWGQDPVGSDITASNARNTADEQNIAWRRAYLSARILGGTLDVGYMAGGPFGTEFMDYENDVPRIKYTYVMGPWIFLGLTEKAFSSSAINPNNGRGVGGGEKSIVNGTVDSDYDKYALAAIYKWSGGEAGGLVQRYVLNTAEHVNGIKRNFNLWIPYFKANIGPVYAEGEILYLQGKWEEYPSGSANADVDIKNFDWYLKARYNFGPAYLGGMVAVIQGDDPGTADKYEAAPFNPENGYTIFQPTLVLWNDWTSRWTGTRHGTSANTQLGSLPTNANIYQIFAGFKPLPKLSIDASYSFLKANEQHMFVSAVNYAAGQRYVSDDYGKEFDIKAAYKIYDNLEYMVAFGYLWAGDFFKGTSEANQVGNDWLLMHKLTLNF